MVYYLFWYFLGGHFVLYSLSQIAQGWQGANQDIFQTGYMGKQNPLKKKLKTLKQGWAWWLPDYYKERQVEKQLREELRIKRNNGEAGSFIKKGKLCRKENFHQAYPEESRY